MIEIQVSSKDLDFSKIESFLNEILIGDNPYLAHRIKSEESSYCISIDSQNERSFKIEFLLIDSIRRFIIPSSVSSHSKRVSLIVDFLKNSKKKKEILIHGL